MGTDDTDTSSQSSRTIGRAEVGREVGLLVGLDAGLTESSSVVLKQGLEVDGEVVVDGRLECHDVGGRVEVRGWM